MNNERVRFAALMVLGLLALTGAVRAAETPVAEIKVNEASFIVDEKPVPLNLAKDHLGKGIDSQFIWSTAELRYPCKNVPEGDYVVSFLATSTGYYCFADIVEERCRAYVNDTRLTWSGVTEPFRAGDKLYQAELLTAKVHVKPTDVLRIYGCGTYAGPVRLYKQSPPVFTEYFNPPDGNIIDDPWLRIDWAQPVSNGQSVTQACKLYNPGVLDRTFTLTAVGRDYFQRKLVDKSEQITVPAGQTVTRNFELATNTSWRARLALRAEAAGQANAIRASKFYINDVTQGPRANMLLNGEWEICMMKAVDPGATPPADAKWEKIKVPSDQIINDEKHKGVHCAWYRKTIDAPAYLKGERIMFRCNEMMTAGKVYLNGQAMGDFHYGSDPFEVDITAGFKPGQKNEILIAVQDWLVNSQKNRERVQNGEEPIYKDGMLDVCDYDSVEKIGIRGPTWIEARPAVSVDNLFVTTSVREKKLSVRYVLRNTSAADHEVTVEPRVLDAGEAVKTLDAKKVTVPAGKTVEVTVSQGWTDAKYWWPKDPHLYILQTTLTPAAGNADVHIQRFGFREFWIDGYSFMLNGMRVKLRTCCVMGAMGKGPASPFWQQDKRYSAIWDWQQRCKEIGELQLVRSHLWSRFDEGVDMADESGVMVKLETGFHQQAFTLDKRFWTAATAYELHLVDVYKNHAAIMLWSGGNENMWGIIYQGEIAKTVFNDWQIKTVKAMEALDPMHRPAEFEADGDLFGGGRYYALHYPRELGTFPDIPVSAWWGPLDGKTVIPYSMGPITLGTKPLTVGESFWPANLAHPYGETLVVGDDAFKSGAYLTKAWVNSSRFFLNGFRDVEFGVIDTYLPLSVLKPHKVILKEETSEFYGGQTIPRRVNVHNDIFSPATLTLKTALIAADGRELIKGSVTLEMAPAELRRMVLDTKLPAVQQVTSATWRVQLLEGENVLDVQERPWKLFPAQALTAPAGLKLAVYDPPGKTADLLKKHGVAFQKLGSLREIPQGVSLLVGEDALKQPPEGPWREALAAFVQKGGKAVILAQVEPLDFLPVTLTQTKEHKATIAFVRAADHPVMAGLTDADLRWWADDHYVSAGNFRKPLNGNWLPLADAGTMEGLLETPLIEEFDGKGSYLLCQFLVGSKGATAPQAGIMLQNMLNYLASSECYRTFKPTALLAGGSQTLRPALETSRLIFTDLTNKTQELKVENFGAAIVDVSALDAPMAQVLRAFAEAGGKVMILGATPAQQAALEGLTGIHLKFLDMAKESDDLENRLVRDENRGLLSGISNHEFFWGGGDYLTLFRREGWWWSDCGPRPKAEWMADYLCLPVDASPEKATVLTHPCAMIQAPAGKGLFLINQIKLDQPFTDVEATARRLRSLLLTNLGCQIQSEAGGDRARMQRLANYQFTPIDLSAWCNRGLKEDKAAGIVGWSNQGENDMRAFKTGPQKLNGVDFTVAAGKSAIGLYSKSGMGNMELPKEVKGIKVGAKADMLFFLHVASYLGGTPGVVCHYHVNYADGSDVDIPLENGKQIFDWWTDPMRYADDMARCSTSVAWRGDNPMKKGLVALCYEWANPHPEKEITTVDFLSEPKSNYEAVVFLLGLTAATAQANEGVVEDIIGTAGVKVKIGTQIKDFYYVGVVGIDKSNAYYDKALAAHKAMAVGQKVTVFLGEMPKASDGRTLAYVCLGKDAGDVRNMLNTRILGDGLGKVGNFEGNNRHRMFMENLSFITEQGKKGMFGGKP
jgi:hypothetical protein